MGGRRNRWRRGSPASNRTASDPRAEGAQVTVQVEPKVHLHLCRGSAICSDPRWRPGRPTDDQPPASGRAAVSGTGTVTAPAVSSGAPTRAHWWILVVIAAAQLMVVLDSTIMIIALPSAQRSLGFSNADRQWVVTAYTLGFGGLLLLGGRIADLIGPKRTLIIGVIGFALASAIGGASQSTGMLIAARGLQGLFGALLTPSVLSL